MKIRKWALLGALVMSALAMTSFQARAGDDQDDHDEYAPELIPAATAGGFDFAVALARPTHPSWSCYSHPNDQGTQLYAQVWPNSAPRSLSRYKLRVLARTRIRPQANVGATSGDDIQELARISWIRSGIQDGVLIYQGESADTAAELLIEARLTSPPHETSEGDSLFTEIPGFLRLTDTTAAPDHVESSAESTAPLNCVRFDVP